VNVKKNIERVSCRRTSGFSLLEALIVVVIIIIVTGMALLGTRNLWPRMRADAGLDTAMGEIRRGRELAISRRRNIQVQFLGNNQIQLVQINVPAAAGITVLDTATLNNQMQFMLFPPLPDTPDAFGKAAPIAFGGTPTMLFLSDGTFVDAAGLPLNGTIFLGTPNQPETARAVTILGATGRIRAYRWNGAAWSN